MVSLFHVVACAVAALACWTALGWPVARRLLPRAMVLPFAPLLGWALHSVFALTIFRLAPSLVPFSRTGIVTVTVLGVAIGWALLKVDRSLGRIDDDGPARVVPWAWAGALSIAILSAVAILPKPVGDAVYLSEQIFDHAKIAMVDDMARLGLPAGNPFFAHDGGSGRLSYYYLLHFGAAEWVRLLGVTGWEADVAMTFFAAFTSLAAMMALAVRFGGRSSASLWVVALAATSSARVVALAVFGDRFDDWISPPGGFGGWLFQAAWVPQHLVSTSCVVLAVVLLAMLVPIKRRRPAGIVSMVAAGLVIAAGFESSTWVGGVVFALVAAVVVPLRVVGAKPAERVGLVVSFGAVGVVALLFALPFLRDQLAASALRGTGFPVAVRLSHTVGDAWPAAWRTIVDGPAWWLLFMPLALPAMYGVGLVGVVHAWRARRVRDGGARSNDASSTATSVAAATLVALLAAWLLVSTIADNNDLGWRAGLLAAVGLIAFGGATLSRWVAARRRVPVGLAIVALLLGLPEAWLQVQRNTTGRVEADGVRFAQAPALWQAVRDRSGPGERIASNPQAFEHMTPWPDNIGWALLANRRSCYAGWELTQVFTAVPHDRLREIDARFRRLFAEGAQDDDEVAALAKDFDCALAVVTREDGAWNHDPFRASVHFELVDERPERWRIYRRREPAGAPSR